MEIAKILNCSRSTYTYYETGKTTPSISVLKLLAKIYNVSLMELLMDESEAGQLRDSSRSDSFDHIKYIYDLSADERLLVGIFRSATPEEQEEILQRLRPDPLRREYCALWKQLPPQHSPVPADDHQAGWGPEKDVAC